ncbi:MAG: histidinol phosphate phosphatase domain-containing protein [Chloroflexota bacterium]
MPDRIDLHTHTFFSDGDLLPSEIVHRAVTLGYAAIALTDHADASNLDQILAQLNQFLREQKNDFPLTVIPGVELTHAPPARIAPLAKRAKELGAGLVVVHGETIVEPVEAGTDRAAVECADVDILAHPGFITLEEARLAAKNGIALEISARKGHSLTNGHVAAIARLAGAPMVVDTDTHSPSDMIDQIFARAVARGAGLSDAEIEAATVTNPRALVERAKKRTN